MKNQKNLRKKILGVSLMIFTIALIVGGLCSSFLPNELAEFIYGSASLGGLAMAGISGAVEEGGGVAGEGIVTTQDVIAEGGDLDVYDLSKQVTMCRPEDAPLDQLMRKLGGGTKTKSQRFEFYRFTQNDCIYETHSTPIVGKGVAGGSFVLTLSTGASDLLTNDVIAFEDASILGHKWDHRGQVSAVASVPLVLQILSKLSATTYNAVIVNDNGASDYTVNIPANSNIFCIGNAQNETVVMSDAYNSLPAKDVNYAQRFMKTVAESDYQAIIDKEVNWGLAQYRNASMYSLRSQIELSMFTGQMRLNDTHSDGSEIYFTGGFEHFIGDRVLDFNGIQPSLADIQELGKNVFSNTNGSAERYMFLSPTAMQKILNIPQFVPTGTNVTHLLQTTDAVDLKGEKLGFTIKKVDTGYGFINLVMHRGLTRRRESTGYVIDIANIRRRVLEPLKVTTYDLEKLAMSKATANVLEECVGLEFQNMDSMQMVKF